MAYNGFRFDYPITLAEIQRNSLSCADIINRGIHFADTYHLLQQVKSSGSCPALSDMPLKMKGLIDAFVPSHNYSTCVAHVFKCGFYAYCTNNRCVFFLVFFFLIRSPGIGRCDSNGQTFPFSAFLRPVVLLSCQKSSGAASTLGK